MEAGQPHASALIASRRVTAACVVGTPKTLSRKCTRRSQGQTRQALTQLFRMCRKLLGDSALRRRQELRFPANQLCPAVDKSQPELADPLAAYTLSGVYAPTRMGSESGSHVPNPCLMGAASRARNAPGENPDQFVQRCRGNVQPESRTSAERPSDPPA